MTRFCWDSLGPLPPTSECRQLILQSSPWNLLKLLSGNSAGSTSSCSLSVLLFHSLSFSRDSRLRKPLADESSFVSGYLLEGIKDTLSLWAPLQHSWYSSCQQTSEAIVILTILKLCTHLKVSFPFIPGSSLVPVWVSSLPQLTQDWEKQLLSGTHTKCLIFLS